MPKVDNEVIINAPVQESLTTSANPVTCNRFGRNELR